VSSNQGQTPASISRSGDSDLLVESTQIAASEQDDVELAAERSCFTNPPSSEPWVLTVADAEAVIASWETPRKPGAHLKAAYAHYLETIGSI